MNLAKWIDAVFGNNDGRFAWSDIVNGAPGVVVVVVDIIMLVAEYRVLDVGHKLTGSWVLAIGFVMVSSIPFYMGQLAFLYNKANWIQQVVAVLMVLMGLAASAWYGFADFVMGTVVSVGVVRTDPIDPSALYIAAVAATAALIVLGLLYSIADDTIWQNIKMSRMAGRAAVAESEMGIMDDLLSRAESLLEREKRLRMEYGDEAYEAMSKGFRRAKKPTTGGAAANTRANAAANARANANANSKKPDNQHDGTAQDGVGRNVHP